MKAKYRLKLLVPFVCGVMYGCGVKYNETAVVNAVGNHKVLMTNIKTGEEMLYEFNDTIHVHGVGNRYEENMFAYLEQGDTVKLSVTKSFKNQTVFNKENGSISFDKNVLQGRRDAKKIADFKQEILSNNQGNQR